MSLLRATLRASPPITALQRQRIACALRTYASAPEHPQSRDTDSTLPKAETFSKTARPGLYYARPQPRDLPPLQSKWPAILLLGAVGVTGWGLFMTYVTNQERLSSSVMQQLMNTVRDNAELRELLGEAIRPEPTWWMNGDPWINGAIHIPGGNIDLSFRIKGHKGAGTLYFTSIRKAKGEPFHILRFRVIGDDGTEVNVNP